MVLLPPSCLFTLMNSDTIKEVSFLVLVCTFRWYFNVAIQLKCVLWQAHTASCLLQNTPYSSQWNVQRSSCGPDRKRWGSYVRNIRNCSPNSDLEKHLGKLGGLGYREILTGTILGRKRLKMTAKWWSQRLLGHFPAWPFLLLSPGWLKIPFLFPFWAKELVDL